MVDIVSAHVSTASRFTLEALPPFRLDLTVWALRRRPANLVDRWDGAVYRRAVKRGSAVVELEVRQGGSSNRPKVSVSATALAAAAPPRAWTAATIRQLLGLDVDLRDFYGLAALDPHLGPLAHRFRGLKPPRFPSVFESLVNAVACQQLSLTVGIALLNRLAQSCGDVGPSGDLHAFPEPADLAAMNPRQLRDLGFSTRKAEVLVEVSQRVVDGELDLEALAGADDDTAASTLQTLRGIGRWSAEYALLRGLGRLGVFPGDDVGARNNLRRWLGPDSAVDYDRVKHAVSRWAPYAGLVYFHLLLDGLSRAGLLDSGATDAAT